MEKEQLNYLEQLEEDLEDEKLAKIISSRINFAPYVSISDFVSEYDNDDILDHIGDNDLKYHLECNGYKIFDRYQHPLEDVGDSDDDDLIDEIILRDLQGVFKEGDKTIDYSKPGKLQRHLCDIVGCGYYQYSNEELLDKIKKML